MVDRLDDSSLSMALARHALTRDSLYQTIETHVMEKTYEMVYYRITSIHRDHDAILANEISNIQHVDLCHMGLPPELGAILMHSVKDFQNIPTLRTPFEKTKCLVRSLQSLTKSPSGGMFSPSLIDQMLIAFHSRSSQRRFSHSSTAPDDCAE